MTTDLATLTTAADGWDDMAKEFGKQEKAYKRDVHGISLGPAWQGLAANTANRRFDTTLNEYQNAQTEAKAIASLLRDAHTQFTDLRGKLKTARQEAIDAGMKVSEQGRVSFDTQRLSEGTRTAYHHDPDYQESVRKSVRSWQDRIDQLVKDTTDADKGVEIAFNAVVIDTDPLDGTLNGFNGQAKGDIEQYEAKNAEDIATRLAGGEKIPAAQLAELDRAFRDNADNKVFSQTFLNGLGTNGTIKLTNRLNDLAYFDAKDDKKSYLGLQKGLAETLASATRVPAFGLDGKPLPPDSKREQLRIGTKEYADAHKRWKKTADAEFYNNWLSAMKNAGIKEYDLAATDVHRVGAESGKALGYQSIVTLMQRGGDYSGAFLHELADDIRAAEDPALGGNKDVWDLSHKFDASAPNKTEGWFANDPLDGLLGVMSKNPDAATAYFDPAHQSGKDRLHYLQVDRDWDVVNDHRTSMKDGGLVYRGDVEDADSHRGFGAALEAAMTGVVPGSDLDPESYSQHSPAESRVLEEVVNFYGEAGIEDHGSAIPQNMRQNFANAVASYPSDIYQVLGKDVDFSDPDYSTDPNDLDLKETSLIRFLREVSEDGGAYRTVHDSQVSFAATEIGGLTKEDLLSRPGEGQADKAKGVAQEAGYVMGTLDQIRADVLIDQRDSEIGANNWNKVYKYHVYGAPVTGLPVIGDTFQRLIDIGTGKEAEALNNEVSNRTREELINHYEEKGHPRLQNMINEHAQHVGVSSTQTTETGGRMMEVNATARSAYYHGLGATRGATGEQG
ncbi:DUF6571 family protein [Streptomyces sp. WAC 01438]|uniref:DUF6571 family protein n=2 Tax=unclassified Streptomyces TaxID=2593676 RepID=UPI000F748194|nr:DUF6571 family protein [Streptomyces sp. WAC 01438]